MADIAVDRDEPRGRQAEPERVSGEVPFVIRRTPGSASSRLIIPRKFLPALAEATGNAVPAEGTTGLKLRRRTTVAGVLLSCVIAGGFLAVIFIRRRKVGRAAATGVAVLTVALLAGPALADLLPNPFRRPRPPRPVVTPDVQVPKVTVTVVESGDEVVLILGRVTPPAVQ
jgi:hypothetical protein